MSVVIKKSGPRALPSAAFYALTQPKIELSEVLVIAEALRTGAWALDANEVDPATGLNFLHTVVRNQIKQHDDEATQALIDVAVAHGVDVNQVAPDGLSALMWAQKNNVWDIAKRLEAHGAKGSSVLNSAQMEAFRSFRDNALHDQWRVRENTRAFIQAFGDPDALVAHQPLALVAARIDLHLNGYGITTEATKPEYSKDLEKTSKAWRDMGEEALRTHPQSQLALWAWMGMAASSALSPAESHNVSPSVRARLASSWRAYEKNLFKARFPRVKQPGEQVQALTEALLGMVPTVLQEVSQHPSQSNKKIQPASAWAIQALRRWHERIKAEGAESASLANAIEPAVWQMAARLFEALPEALWKDSTFVKGWCSAAHYELFHPLRSQDKKSTQVPDYVEQPWVTLAPLLKRHPQVEDPFIDTALGWLASVPIDPNDTKLPRFLETVDGNLLAAWRKQHLTHSLDEAGVPGPRAPRF